MKKIVIIGANDFQNPLILKAKEMGLETHVFAWKENAIGEKTADYFYPISIVEKDKILDECKKIKPIAVTTIASDLANITVQYIAERLGLPCNSFDTIQMTTNKLKMRTALSKANISCPQFIQISKESDLDKVANFNFPVIVKPSDRSGSRGINKVIKFENLGNAVKEAITYSFEKKAIIEEYIEGEEFSCESISFRGKHVCLAITKKYTTGSPHFIETAHIEPADLSFDMIGKIKSEITKALNALKIEYGASHSEFKIDKYGNIKIIEIGSRMGGDCIGSDLVRLSTGYDFVRMVIETAMGVEPTFDKVCEPKVAVIRFVLSQKDIEILEYLKENRPNDLKFISEIKEVNKDQVFDSSTRGGFYIITCENISEAREIAEK